MNNLNHCNEFEALISGYLDNELTQQDHQKVAVHLKSCDSCHQDYLRLKELQVSVSQLTYPDMETQQLEALMNDKTSTTLENTSWLLIAFGTISLSIIGIIAFIFENNEPWFIKLAFISIYVGIVGLTLSVLRQRLITRKKDKYRKVKL